MNYFHKETHKVFFVERVYNNNGQVRYYRVNGEPVDVWKFRTTFIKCL